MIEMLAAAAGTIIAFGPAMIVLQRREKRLTKREETVFERECQLNAMAALLGVGEFRIIGVATTQTIPLACGDTVTLIDRAGVRFSTITAKAATTLEVTA